MSRPPYDGEPAPLPTWATLVRADNPGPMTLDGTNTYVLRASGADDAAGAVVVDPGPLDEVHLAAVAAVAPVALIVLTHGHPDHSDGARTLHEMTGAPLTALDPTFCVDAEPLAAGAVLDAVRDLPLRVLATPGHTGDSVSFVVAHDEAGLLTGDTILGRGTTVVAHPDGRLGPYLRSLAAVRDLDQPLTLLPGHGPAGGDARERAQAYLVHRAQRLDQVRAALAAGDSTAEEVVRRVYADVDPVLWPAAELSVRAQLDYLADATHDR
jgi:glyoxylase-like metal-dependent hydrolase (beta-lactamase superfamily II)